MEDKIEVNEYVRTDRGEIAKVTSVAKETLGEILGINEYRSIGFCNTEPYVYGNIVKHNKIISEVVETGDYVNGKLIHKIDKGPNYCYLYYGNCKTFVDYQIKTILTKESYMANCYKVGGEE
jgi:hypothetical protein